MITIQLTKWIIALSVITTLAVGAVQTNGDLTKPNFHPLKQHHELEQLGLEQYKKETEQKLKQVVAETKNDSVFVTISFSKYLNKQELDKLITDYGIETKFAIVRSIEKSTGLRVTATTNPLDEQWQQELMNRNGADFKGYIELIGHIPVDQAETLTADENVYLVDPSADSSLVLNADEDYTPGVFWDLEEEGFVQQ